jgi:hypothetical protein
VRTPPLTAELVEDRFSELQQLSRLGASLLDAELPPLDRRALEHRSLRVVARCAGRGADPRDVRLHVLPSPVDRQLGWMPDAWVDPTTGLVVGRGLTVLVGACVNDQPLDALPRNCAATISLRFLAQRPACIDALPLLDHTDQHVRLWSCAERDRQRTRW